MFPIECLIELSSRRHDTAFHTKELTKGMWLSIMSTRLSKYSIAAGKENEYRNEMMSSSIYSLVGF